MNAKRQDEIYYKLLQLWRLETIQDEILDVRNDLTILRDTRDLFKELKRQWSESKNSLEREVLNKLMNNIDFILNDFLNLRGFKILRLAQLQKSIDLKKLFPFEREFYGELLNAYRRFGNARRLFTGDAHAIDDMVHPNESTGEEIQEFNKVGQDVQDNARASFSEPVLEENLSLSGTSETESDLLSRFDEDIEELEANDISIAELLVESSEDESEIFPEENLPSDGHVENIQESEMAKDIGSEKSTPVKSKALLDKDDNKTTETESSVSSKPTRDVKPPMKSVNFMLIRFARQYPAIVGYDLKIYGPFKKEDIAFLPSKNAIILIRSNFAEPIRLER